MLDNKIKKIDIIKKLSNKTGLSLNFSKKVLNDLISIINNNIKSGKLVLKNVGTFRVIKKKQRIGRNPKTKEEFTISSRKSISFISSRIIIDTLNKLL